jgi:hypothetical protein
VLWARRRKERPSPSVEAGALGAQEGGAEIPRAHWEPSQRLAPVVPRFSSS